MRRSAVGADEEIEIGGHAGGGVGGDPLRFVIPWRIDDPSRQDAADREVDRLRASARGLQVGKLLEGVDYKKASEGLVPYCLALMQNVPDEEQQKLVHALQLLDEEEIEQAIKVRILGLQLMNVVGPDVLTAAVEALRGEMKVAAATA